MPESTTATSGRFHRNWSAQSTGVRSTPDARMISSASAGGLARRATLQRLHDDHRDALAGGVLESLGARLQAGVHVVVLDLAQVPVKRVDDALEHRQRVVEREADVPDEAGVARFHHLVEEPEALHLLKRPGAHRVEQVGVQVVGLQPLE